jgi:uroporphyrinogen-III decarboxylase
MNSKERLLAAINGQPADRVPLTTWCFGFPAPKHLRWETNGRPVPYWYSKRLEHIHTLPHPWELEDEFKRAEAWLSIGVDDVLEVSVPWSQDPAVVVKDSLIPLGDAAGSDKYPVLVRQYETPSGPLRHAVWQTGEEEPGWPVQPDRVMLFEDYNVARAVEHPVSRPCHVPAIRHLFLPPDAEQRRWFADRVAKMKAFADQKGLLIQAWSAFGMDAAVWVTGTQGAVMMALDAPEAFAQLIDLIAQTDYARTELAATTDGVDVVCQRGWYSSTDFWSPQLFDEYVFGHLAELAALVHRHGKKFAYTVTTGVERLGPRIADAGVDLLYFVDPVMDRISVEKAKALFGDRMAMAGGTNALSLASADPVRIRREVRQAIEVLGPTNRFVLQPTDAIFPDTPWEGVELLIEAWRECR